jgi:calcium/calmodulin-dependent protein kinase I
LRHRWLTGKTASDHNLLPEIRAYVARARLRRGIELVKLANRIEALKMQEDMEDDAPGMGDVPAGVGEAVGGVLASGEYSGRGIDVPENRTNEHREKKSLSKLARGAIFREVVLAKVRELKEEKAQKKFEEELQSSGSKPPGTSQ